MLDRECPLAPVKSTAGALLYPFGHDTAVVTQEAGVDLDAVRKVLAFHTSRPLLLC
jgi:alpha-D-ribose 1-methylphosphonate 5-triphosphate synthase subunit PhnH